MVPFHSAQNKVEVPVNVYAVTQMEMFVNAQMKR